MSPPLELGATFTRTLLGVRMRCFCMKTPNQGSPQVPPHRHVPTKITVSVSHRVSNRSLVVIRDAGGTRSRTRNGGGRGETQRMKHLRRGLHQQLRRHPESRIRIEIAHLREGRLEMEMEISPRGALGTLGTPLAVLCCEMSRRAMRLGRITARKSGFQRRVGAEFTRIYPASAG